jgi:hypothetical protein
MRGVGISREKKMQEDDYKLTPCGYLGGKTGVSQYDKFLGEFSTTDEALEFVKEHMEEEQFFPNIWWISDHGNAWLIDLDGKEITDEHEHDWGEVEYARFPCNPYRRCLICDEIDEIDD